MKMAAERHEPELERGMASEVDMRLKNIRVPFPVAQKPGMHTDGDPREDKQTKLTTIWRERLLQTCGVPKANSHTSQNTLSWHNIESSIAFL